MASEYSVDLCKELETRFIDSNLHRPMRVARYDAGAELSYEVQGLGDGAAARVRLVVEQFVGGGFAGQVYKVKVLGVESTAGSLGGLEAGQTYAMKILVPPSTFSRIFRNFLYWIGFQGPFQLQVNPAAARAGALWQKFIRRAAKTRFGDERTVVDIYGTFVDERLGSCGELSEWIDGRTWLLEVDDRLDLLRRWRRGRAVNEELLGSPEYRTKRLFMCDFVALLTDMGAYEFARQYEWATCKSQPNCLKRRETEDGAFGGLVAVDFRAGLALLPFLPMSPGDFKLIAKGIARGSLVQFDRGSVRRLEAFVKEHSEDFGDMIGLLEELKASERIYRDSVCDITHNHVRLLFSRRLWSTILDSAIVGWKVRNLIDCKRQKNLRDSRVLTVFFLLIGAVPFLGKFFRRIWGREDWRKHYCSALTSRDYFCRAVKGRIAEKVVIWHRAGRLDRQRAARVAASVCRFVGHWPLSVLPAGLHRFLTDGGYAKERLGYYIVRPVRLYFNAGLREQWLREMVTEGRKKHMLGDEDAEVILSQINEPFIQKYLKSLAVHVCTLPVTQIVSVFIAVVYVLTHPEMPRTQAWGIGLAIIALFQVVPLSPGSLVRGLYVLYLVIRERNFKDYNIAVFLAFFKYVGYLAFPIQMTYHYPALARFMAAHWATEAVHIVPVFGERGALLEHWAFCLFYNWPLTIRRRIRRRSQVRASKAPRYWHVPICAVAGAAAFGLADSVSLHLAGELPTLRDLWWLVATVAILCGAGVTLGCGGVALGRRIVAAAASGVLMAAIYVGVSAVLGCGGSLPGGIVAICVWRVFVFAILSTLGAIGAELLLPHPDLR